MWIEVDIHASKQGLKETNKIEIKQQKSKSKSNRKSKATKYTIFEDKFQMPEYTTFEKSELLVSYSNFLFEKMDSLAKLTVLAAIQSPSFPSIYIAIDAACARKITAHLCQQRQRQLAPRCSKDHLGGQEAAQHTPLIA